MADRILLIEDDDALGAQLRDRLASVGYGVDWWRHGRPVDEATAAQYVLIILDLMLPGTPGLDILKALRPQTDIPVLVLSARQDTSDKVRALQLGADDYLTKPFWPEELLERVKARLRRPAMERRPGTIEVGPLAIDVMGRTVRLAGHALDVTRVEFDLLHALARRAGAAVTRQALVEKVLDPDRDTYERTLDVHVSRLRRKLGEHDLIETVWGIGYRMRKDAS